jgi:hypothetical protein
MSVSCLGCDVMFTVPAPAGASPDRPNDEPAAPGTHILDFVFQDEEKQRRREEEEPNSRPRTSGRSRTPRRKPARRDDYRPPSRRPDRGGPPMWVIWGVALMPTALVVSGEWSGALFGAAVAGVNVLLLLARTSAPVEFKLVAFCLTTASAVLCYLTVVPGIVKWILQDVVPLLKAMV